MHHQHCREVQACAVASISHTVRSAGTCIMVGALAWTNGPSCAPAMAGSLLLALQHAARTRRDVSGRDAIRGSDAYLHRSANVLPLLGLSPSSACLLRVTPVGLMTDEPPISSVKTSPGAPLTIGGRANVYSSSCPDERERQAGPEARRRFNDV